MNSLLKVKEAYPILCKGDRVQLGELGYLTTEKKIVRQYDFTESEDGVVRSRRTVRKVVYVPSQELTSAIT